MAQKKLIAKLVEVMKAVKHIPKTGYNQQQKYRYAQEADVVEKVRTELADLGIFLKQSVKEHSFRTYTTAKGTEMTIATLVIEFTFIDSETGETESFTVVGEGQDSGDKAVYKALTGATKYALMKTFLIPTGDDPERDEEEPRGEKTQKLTQKKTQRKQAKSEPPGKKDNGKMNEQQDKAITNMVAEITDGDPNKLQKLDEWIGGQIEGFPGLGKEMSYDVAAQVIRLLVRYKQRKAAEQ